MPVRLCEIRVRPFPASVNLISPLMSLMSNTARRYTELTAGTHTMVKTKDNIRLCLLHCNRSHKDEHTMQPKCKSKPFTAVKDS
jgi:hypothetical protein